MSRRQIIFLIIITVAVIVSLSSLIVTTIDDVNSQLEQECFDELEDTAKVLAEEIKQSSDSSRAILNAMAAIISGMDDKSNKKLCEVLNTFSFDASYISYKEILFPDNTMLYSDGLVEDVSETLNFDRQATAGEYISNLTQSAREKDEMVIRNAVPVVQNGRTIYIIYGVIRVSDLAEKYKADIYDGHAYVLIEDGDTGDFLLDTWHETLGKVQDLGSRKIEPGYSWNKFINDIRAGRSGRVAFTSKTIGEVVYLRYEPIGVNNWNIMVMTPQYVALHQSEDFSKRLYFMAAIIWAVMLLYMLSVTWCLLSAYRRVRKISNEDPITGLQNRNAYQKFCFDTRRKKFDSISCVFVDLNGLHEVNNKYGHMAGDEMLQIVARALLAEFTFEQVFRIGGDEFLIISENADADECALKMKRVEQEIEAHDYYISFGVSHRENETGVDRISQEADARMLENKRAYYAENERRNPRATP